MDGWVNGCATCQNISCRCKNCVALVEGDWAWECDELHTYCSDVDVCPEWSEEAGINCDGYCY